MIIVIKKNTRKFHQPGITGNKVIPPVWSARPKKQEDDKREWRKKFKGDNYRTLVGLLCGNHILALWCFINFVILSRGWRLLALLPPLIGLRCFVARFLSWLQNLNHGVSLLPSCTNDYCLPNYRRTNGKLKLLFLSCSTAPFFPFPDSLQNNSQALRTSNTKACLVLVSEYITSNNSNKPRNLSRFYDVHIQVWHLYVQGRPSCIIKSVQATFSHFVRWEHTAGVRELKREQPCEVFWGYPSGLQSVYPTALLITAHNRRKQLLLLALTSDEQNMKRPGPTQLAMATHGHETSRERQACDLSCLYFVSFSSLSKKASYESRRSHPFLTHDGAKTCWHNKNHQRLVHQLLQFECSLI